MLHEFPNFWFLSPPPGVSLGTPEKEGPRAILNWAKKGQRTEKCSRKNALQLRALSIKPSSMRSNRKMADTVHGMNVY